MFPSPHPTPRGLQPLAVTTPFPEILDPPLVALQLSYVFTRNLAVADKPRDAFVQVQWRG